MTEFLCAIAPAVLAWIGGFFFFVLRLGEEKMSKFEMSQPLPIKAEAAEAAEAAGKHAVEFLRELVRLAEENMKELEEFSNSYERKAALLASVSLAVSGYLLSGLNNFTMSWGWGSIIYFSFGMATVFSAKAIDFAAYAPRGLHPKVVRGFFAPGRDPNSKEMEWILYYMLETYRKGVDKNVKSICKKYRYLIWAKFFLVAGAGGFLGMALQSAGVSAHICRWAADFLACPTC